MATGKQIRKLEEGLGVELFRHSPHGVELTEAGVVAVRRVEKMLEEWEVLKQEITPFKEIRNFRLGTLPSLFIRFLPEKLRNKPLSVPLEIRIMGTFGKVVVRMQIGASECRFGGKRAGTIGMEPESVHGTAHVGGTGGSPSGSPGRSVFFRLS
jgi:DNA-binding transcriptional LysR family regulator